MPIARKENYDKLWDGESQDFFNEISPDTCERISCCTFRKEQFKNITQNVSTGV